MGVQDAPFRRVAQWRDSLDSAATLDNWGQMLEACNEYDKVVQGIKSVVAVEKSPYPDDLTRFLTNVAIAAKLRSKAAQDLTGKAAGVSLADMKQLITTMKSLPDTVPAFPLPDVEGFKHLMPTAAISMPKVSNARAHAPDDDDEEESGDAIGGNLRPRMHFPGQTNVTIRIERIQLKDPSSYFEPFFTVSVKDVAGKDLCEPQDTPTTNRKDDAIHFTQPVEIQMPLEDLPPDCAIFLEFKHFKPRKNKTSVKCFSLLELDELVPSDQPVPLEIYAKPTDFKRKRLHLLTEKKMYLWVSIALTKN
eukprot:TRINITY_DN6840_c0_g1_i1.p1 TRINITY_DN6840_c0_g1~~TRINITY_DN6840_c0_g1_i1.p1  ORF type:complete len:306 (+),score=72.67 TRINITY_DN6840_c0_g1_i1:56-973(+)